MRTLSEEALRGKRARNESGKRIIPGVMKRDRAQDNPTPKQEPVPKQDAAPVAEIGGIEKIAAIGESFNQITSGVSRLIENNNALIEKNTQALSQDRPKKWRFTFERGYNGQIESAEAEAVE
jgi:hypothetical protein